MTDKDGVNMEAIAHWHSNHSSRCHGIQSPWWAFNHCFQDKLPYWLKTFSQGEHAFGPMKQYASFRVWSPLDRLLIHLIDLTIKTTFKHVMDKNCHHLKDPTIIKYLSNKISVRLSQYNYFYRLDIRSYYDSIDHKLLTSQMINHYDDPRIVKNLCRIITAGVDINAHIHLPMKGIPIGSALSPFFGALYLKDLDRAKDRPNVFYVRYMDDILILFKSKRNYLKARKTIARILGSLKLMPSPRKTSHCALDKKGFHFLGIDDCLIRTKRWIQTQVKLNVRTLIRAHDKALAHYHADAPAATQRYLCRWAAWWSFSHELNAVNHLKTWALVYPDLGRLAFGVLLGSHLRHRLALPTSH